MIWGWDSQVSGPYDFEVDGSKVFSNNGVVFGVAGALRLANVLEYMDIPEPPMKSDAINRYVVKTLCDAIRNECRYVDLSSNSEGQAGVEGSVLVSVRGRVYDIGSDFSACRNRSKTYGIGSGSAFALGALAAGADPLTALKIAAKMDTGTGGRLYVKTESEVLG